MISKQALGKTLWTMANILYDKVDDYKSYILPLLFYKRLSDNYQWEDQNNIKQFVKENGREPTAAEKKIILKDKHDFIIPDGYFWKEIRSAPTDQKNEKLEKTCDKIAEVNKDANGKQYLKGIIDSCRWNAPAQDGSGKKKLDPDVLSSLISYLNPVDLSNKNVTVDVLGDAYEYLIKKFADENKGGTVAGQFYTPQQVVDIIVRYLNPQKGDSIYDPTCGSGGFLINAAHYAQEKYKNKKAVRLFGQELIPNTWAIANINMILHGLDAQIKRENTILHPQFTEDDNDLVVKKFNKVMANFPFSQPNWAGNGEVKKDKKGKEELNKDGTPKWEYKSDWSDPYNRMIYGMPEYSNGDFAFIQHIVASLDENGKAGIVCPQGVFFRGQPEKTEEEDGQSRKADNEYLIRRSFLQGIAEDGNFKQVKNIIEAIIFLPVNLFYGTTIPGSILFINKNKPKERENKVLMVYAGKKGWYREDPNLNVLEPQDLMRISTLLESWGDKDVAQKWINEQKVRLFNNIQDDLDFEIFELEEDCTVDNKERYEKLEETKKKIEERIKEGKTPKKADKDKAEKLKAAIAKRIAEKDTNIEIQKEIAQRKRMAIEDVEKELIEVLSNPELSKRYFSVVDMEEIEENEFNLNIPRYVDTFEPEEEIDLNVAIKEYNNFIESEKKSNEELNLLLSALE